MDVWRIGVRIGMTNGVSPVLAVIAADLLGLKGKVGEVEKAFRSLNPAIIGAGAVLAGGALLDGVFKMADKGKELIDQQDKLVRQNIDLNDVLRIQADFFDNVSKSVPTATASEYLKTVNELRSVAGDLNGAAAMAPRALKYDALLGNVLGTEQSGSFYKLLRSSEIKGIATDEDKREKFTEEAFKYMVAFGGKLTPDAILGLAKRGGNAWHAIGLENMGPVMVAAADMGGDNTGTALMSLRQFQMGATTLSRQQGELLGNLGLLDMSKAHKTGFGGGRLQLDPGAMVGALQYSDDLPGWIKNVVYPAIEKASHGDEALLENILGKFSPNRSITKMIQMFGDPGFQDQITKDMGLQGQAMPVDQAYDDFLKNNPKGVDTAFHNQFKSMMEAIGGPLAQAAIPVMKALTTAFQEIGQLANAHPDAVKAVGVGIAVLAGGLVALGTAAVVTAAAALAPGGAVALAVVGISGAIATLVALNWDSAQQVLNSIVSGLTFFINQIKATLGDLKSIFSWGMPGSNPNVTPGNRAPGAGQQQWQAPGPGGRGAYSPTNWAPPANGNQPVQIHTALNVDGRRLANAVSTHVARNSAWSSSSSSFDGRAMAAPTDVNFI